MDNWGAIVVLASGAVASAALALVNLRKERRARIEADAGVAQFRHRLAATLDTLREAQQANERLSASLRAREQAAAEIQDLNQRNAECIGKLIHELNRTNARCAALQQAVRGEELSSLPYWMARLDDGTIVGPFSRS